MAFGTHLRHFIESQAYSFRTYSPQGPFAFDGEYSIVARDLNVVGRRDSVQVSVHDLKDAIRRATGLDFGPNCWRYLTGSPVGNPDGIVTRFACVCAVNMLSPSAPYPLSLVPRNMLGELEIFVLPNARRMPIVPGEKTIVRFRLFG